MEKAIVNVRTENDQVIIRTGEAPKVQYPKAINITGILAAPFQFYEGKKDSCPPEKCNIQIKKDLGEITLNVLDTDPNSASQITGKLKKDSFFEQWGINTDKRWTVSAFLKQVKMQRVFFTEKTEADQIILSLQKWQASVETVIKDHNDNSGNSLSMLERKVSNIDLKSKFKLTIPIFQGYAKQTFTVEIGFDAKTNSVDLYLFSNDLFELEIVHRESLIESELAKFNDFHCSKVVLS